MCTKLCCCLKTKTIKRQIIPQMLINQNEVDKMSDAIFELKIKDFSLLIKTSTNCFNTYVSQLSIVSIKATLSHLRF